MIRSTLHRDNLSPFLSYDVFRHTNGFLPCPAAVAENAIDSRYNSSNEDNTTKKDQDISAEAFQLPSAKQVIANDFIPPIDPGVCSKTYGLRLSWYEERRPVGISLLILARNESANLRANLESIFDMVKSQYQFVQENNTFGGNTPRAAQGHKIPIEIVVVDNGSTDDTAKIVLDLMQVYDVRPTPKSSSFAFAASPSTHEPVFDDSNICGSFSPHPKRLGNVDTTTHDEVDESTWKNYVSITYRYYPYRIGKPGLETYVTPSNSVHSVVYMTQWAMQQCSLKYTVIWNADFTFRCPDGSLNVKFWNALYSRVVHANRKVLDALKDDQQFLKKDDCTFSFSSMFINQYDRSEDFDSCRMTVIDAGGIENGEYRINNTDSSPCYMKDGFWEFREFVFPMNKTLEIPKEEAVLYRRRNLSIKKMHYSEQPWWCTVNTDCRDELSKISAIQLSNYLASVRSIYLSYERFRHRLPPNIQLFTRANDPSANALLSLLPRQPERLPLFDILAYMYDRSWYPDRFFFCYISDRPQAQQLLDAVPNGDDVYHQTETSLWTPEKCRAYLIRSTTPKVTQSAVRYATNIFLGPLIFAEAQRVRQLLPDLHAVGYGYQNYQDDLQVARHLDYLANQRTPKSTDDSVVSDNHASTTASNNNDNMVYMHASSILIDGQALGPTSQCVLVNQHYKRTIDSYIRSWTQTQELQLQRKIPKLSMINNECDQVTTTTTTVKNSTKSSAVANEEESLAMTDEALWQFAMMRWRRRNDVATIGSERKDVKIIAYVTTCKRLKLFQVTMRSLLRSCSDIFRIDEWICIDDNSSESDRQAMRDEFPWMRFIMKTPEQKYHYKSMNILHDLIQTDYPNCQYLLNTDDDWVYITTTDLIGQSLRVLSANPKFGQCLFVQNYQEEHHVDCVFSGEDYYRSNAMPAYRVHRHLCGQEYDQFAQKHGRNHAWWPSFSFRASLMRAQAWREIGKFKETMDNFELEYARRYHNQGWRSAMLFMFHSQTIGPTTYNRSAENPNAYIMNGML